MSLLHSTYEMMGRLIPWPEMQMVFMQRALLGILILAPLSAVMGIQVVNFRLAFFADAIGHSVFAGVGLGLIFSVHSSISMPVFGVLVGVTIMEMARRSAVSHDTVIGVVFSAVVALGIAIVSREPESAREFQRFLYGDILTISDPSIIALIILGIVLLTYQILAYNRLIYTGLSPKLARAHRVPVHALHLSYAVLLSLVVVFAVRATGVLLVTALLIVPAAAARNFARSAASMLWWALLVSLTSGVIGLYLSAQPWARTATGATIVLVGTMWFAASLGWRATLDRLVNPSD